MTHANEHNAPLYSGRVLGRDHREAKPARCRGARYVRWHESLTTCGKGRAMECVV